MADMRAKCIIKNKDEGTQLVAYFNPKEISVTKSVPWNKHKGSKGDNPVLEFTNANPMEMSLELLFDTYETRKNVYREYVQTLESFTLIMDPDSEDKKRPPMVTFIWGEAFPSFTGVIESLTTKYTMFFEDGTPCRATCQVKLKQAESIARKGENRNHSQSQRGTTSQEGQERRPDQLAGEDGDHRAVMDSAGDDSGNIPPGSHVPGGS